MNDMNHSRQIELECPALSGEDVFVRRIEGAEEISRPFELRVEVAVPEGADINDEELVESAAEVVFYHAGEEKRRLYGIVAEAEELLLNVPGYTIYRLAIAPRVFRLTLDKRIEVFVEKTLDWLIREKLTNGGFREDVDFKLTLSASYPAQEFTVQYAESDLAFISRLCEHFGVAFHFDHSGGRDMMVFTDQNSGFTEMERPLVYRVEGEPPELFELKCARRAVPNRVLLRDNNYHKPQLDLSANASISGGGAREVYEYGANFENPTAGQQLAQVRAEEIVAGRTIFSGKSSVLELVPGSIITAEGYPRGDRKLLVVEVRHAFEQAIKEGQQDEQLVFRNSFVAIPAEAAYRPPRRVPKPRVSGLLTGTIDASEHGDYAEVDDEGRYRVRFHFDASGSANGHASAMVRMAQPHAGPNYGMHFPLRPNVEVIIAFIDGDPDRPVIAGCVPNALNPSPVTQQNNTRNVLRTGGNNEIYMEDQKGNERIHMATPKHNTVFQLGSPNAEEEGAFLSTGAHVTVASGETSSALSPMVSNICEFNSAWHGNKVSLAEVNKVERVGLILKAIASVATLVGKAEDILVQKDEGDVEEAEDAKSDAEEEAKKAAEAKSEAEAEKNDAADEKLEAEQEKDAAEQAKELADQDKERKEAERNSLRLMLPGPPEEAAATAEANSILADSSASDHDKAVAQAYLDKDQEVADATTVADDKQTELDDAEEKLTEKEDALTEAESNLSDKEDEAGDAEAQVTAKEDAKKHAEDIKSEAEQWAKGGETVAAVSEGAEALLSTYVSFAMLVKRMKIMARTLAAFVASEVVTKSGKKGRPERVKIPKWKSGVSIDYGEKVSAIVGDVAFVDGKETRVHGFESIDITSHEKGSMVSPELELLGRDKVAVRSQASVYICSRKRSVGTLPAAAEVDRKLYPKKERPEEVEPPTPSSTQKVAIVGTTDVQLWAEKNEFLAASGKDATVVAKEKVVIAAGMVQAPPGPGGVQIPTMPTVKNNATAIHLEPTSMVANATSSLSVTVGSPLITNPKAFKWGLQETSSAIVLGDIDKGTSYVSIQQAELKVGSGPTTSLELNPAEATLKSEQTEVDGEVLVHLKGGILIGNGNLINLG